jgi:hypothetical protein
LKKTYVFSVLERIENIVGQARQEIDDEPTLQVVEPNQSRIADHLTGLTHVSGVKVEHDVEEENDVDNRVDDEQWDVVHRLRLECHVEGHEHGRVECEKQDDPVPHRFECAIVQDDVWRRFRRLLSVLR